VLLKTKNLTPAQKLTWLAIRDREGKNGQAWPSLATIAADTGLGRRTIIEAIQGTKGRNSKKERVGLIELGWLISEKTTNSNIYECWIPDGAESALVRKAHRSGAESALAGSAESAPKPTKYYNQQKNQHNLVPCDAPSAVAGEQAKGLSLDSRKTAEDSTDIVAVFDAFRDSGIWPVPNYGNKTERKAAAELHRLLPGDQLKKALAYALAAKTDRFSGTVGKIVKPSQLIEQLTNLRGWASKNPNGHKDSMIIDLDQL
jgi:hypothetical protein